MCGIVGAASRRGAPAPETLERMRDALAHRGPDGAGSWRSDDGTVALGHRRLSILDLSPAGAQPMHAEGGEAVLVFNGEIYNFPELRRELEGMGHRFRSGSDTEVLLAAYRAWGPDCLERLNGMFAFALHDLPRRRLFLARDRAGEKPLFYRHAEGRFAFASELKALLADPATPREVDPEALEAYLAYGYVPGAGCILRGVHKLLPGHALLYDVEGDELREWAWWRLPDAPPAGAPADPDLLADELEGLLEDAVRRQLVADVPVGVLLSGGLDSSLVTAMAARAGGRVKTFTITFPGHGGFDEAAYARLVARHFGTEHVELEAEPATVELLPRLARQYDEPMADSSMVPTYLVSRLVREHATVALGGDGGDELFGGYPHYCWLQQQERARRVVPAPLRRAMAGVGAATPVGVRGRNYLMGFGHDAAGSVAHVNLYFDAATRARLLAPLAGRRTAGPEAARRALVARGASTLRGATEADFRSYLPDDILVKVDRASMLASLEVRAPFLDHRVVELAFGRVPDGLRATASARKILLRRVAARVLPPELDLQRKQGFSLPLGAWLKGAWGGFVESVLAEAPPTLFEPREVRALLEAQRRGRSNAQRIFALVLFELWRREYSVTLPA
jgi:asparagine synthase (glutamine-hydrolysing)